MKVLLFLTLSMMFSSLALAGNPDCGGADGYAANMAFVYLKNAGIVQNSTIEFSKTKMISLASEKIGRDLYRQVYEVIFTESSGKTIEVITVNVASNEECSIGDVKAFLVSKQLGIAGY